MNTTFVYFESRDRPLSREKEERILSNSGNDLTRLYLFNNTVKAETIPGKIWQELILGVKIHEAGLVNEN